MPSRRTDHHRWQDVTARQEGLISRSQLMRLGLPPELAENRLRSGRWSRVLPGVYSTSGLSGQVPELARVWAAILYAGPGAAASHSTALWLAGAVDRLPFVLEVVVPQPRQVATRPGLRVRRTSDLALTLHPVLQPPRTRIEVAVLDLAANCTDAEAVIDVILRAIQRRLTTAERLRAELGRRARHRWRRLATEVLAEAEDGVTTALERRYARDVERAHGLPRGTRNRNWPDERKNSGSSSSGSSSSSSSRYLDIRYEKWGIVVETDGREAHPDDEDFRDLRRDNCVVVGGEAPLRYGWRDVAGRPCEAARQVVIVLWARGWRGTPRSCGPACPITPAAVQERRKSL